MNRLQPGTGTNYYYAKRHGEPIRNAVDCLGITFFDDYRPTGASNSIDAAQILWNGGPPEPRRPRVQSHSPAPAPSQPQGPPSNYAYTLTPAPQPNPNPAPQPAPLDYPLQQLSRADAEQALQPGNGWTAQDSARQMQAFQHCPGDTAARIVGSGFDQSIALGESSFSKSGWGAGLTLASAAAGLAGLAMVFSNPSTAAALIGGAAAGALGSTLLIRSSHQDTNDSNILSDMATRIHQKGYQISENRKSSHGNYLADFSRS